jgi:predicted small lipoprotein YifL
MHNRYPLALLLALLFAAGCGQTGQLYLPGDPSEIRTDIPRQDQTQPEENDEDEQDESESGSN